MTAVHWQDDFVGAEMRGCFHVFEKTVDLSIEPEAEELSEASLEAYDETPEKFTVDIEQPLPKKQNRRRHARQSMEASELGGFWEYKLDSIDDPGKPLEEDPATRANLQSPESVGEESYMLATAAQSCFPAERSTLQQQRRPSTTNMGWDTEIEQQDMGDLLPLQREDDGMFHAGLSGGEGTKHVGDFHHLDSNLDKETSDYASNINEKHDSGAGTAANSQGHVLYDSNISDKDFQITPLLAPVAEILQQQECFVQFHTNTSVCPGAVVADEDEIVGEQGEGSQDEPASKYHLHSKDSGFSVEEADTASNYADIALNDEMNKAVLESDVSQLQQIEHNETFFFADESLGWYGIGYGSYVNNRPETRKRVEFYTILYFRGIIEAMPQISGA